MTRLAIGRLGAALAILLVALVLATCRSTAPPAAGGEPSAPAATAAPAAIAAPEDPAAPSRALPAALSPSARRWVARTLAAMSPEQKAAQMVMVRAFGIYQHPRSEDAQRLLAEIRDLQVGGVVVFDSDLESVPRLLNTLQEAAPVPLLVASDFERGAAFRIRRGVAPLPYAMALGAAGSEALARDSGAITAREARALGIHWVFAPVADVNVDPANPVINIRAFGEDPALVARLCAAFIAGAQGGGVLTTAKHFPGHGDTALDSHFALPTVHADRARLEAVELVPFRRAIAAGVDSVMLGHLAIPALDSSGTPASLSTAVIDGVLRRELGFRGLVVTDAMEMTGARVTWPGAASVRAVAAGSDVLLLPPDPRVAVQALARAVAEGQLETARIDASVRRILTAKARLGLHRERRVDPRALSREVGRPADLARAEAIAEASITVVRNRGGVLPLHVDSPLRLLHLTIVNRPRSPITTDALDDALDARGVPVEARYLGAEVTAATADALVAGAPGFSHLLVSTLVGASSSGLSASQLRLLERLRDAGPPLIVLSLDSPYLLSQIPEVPVSLLTYGAAGSSQRAAVAALFGEIPVRGMLPVTLPGLAPRGYGIALPARVQALAEEVAPESRGLPADAFREVDRLLASFVEQQAFPGAVLAVGQRGALVHLEAYGRLWYGDDAPPVRVDTIYDLASLTKVVATTTMAMILLDEQRLSLDDRVQDFLPGFTGAGKEAVTVRHLLTHSAGIDWWAPLYRRLSGPAAYLRRIQAMDLVYPPGSRALYSDLGLILLGEVLQRAAGQPLDAFVRGRVFAPLGMDDTQFRPGAELVARIAPTERDPWRGRLLRGEVHDENAHALGGVAPHAGLFSTAPDLARFAHMLLAGGVYQHRRLVRRETVERFTRRAGVPDSSRALGWDTKSAEGSSAGTLFSPRSFGHTGFTGTSLWIDPARELFVILLTNRVHPSRDNVLIRRVRPAVADAVVRAVDRR